MVSSFFSSIVSVSRGVGGTSARAANPFIASFSFVGHGLLHYRPNYKALHFFKTKAFKMCVNIVDTCTYIICQLVNVRRINAQ